MRRTRNIFCAVLLFVASFGMLLRAQAPAGKNRPAGVPEEYVITPFGYFHPSCVLQIAKGETLLADGRVLQHADGTLEDLPACEYPHYVASGEIAGAGVTKVESPTIDGWVEYASQTIGTEFYELFSNEVRRRRWKQLGDRCLELLSLRHCRLQLTGECQTKRRSKRLDFVHLPPGNGTLFYMGHRN